MFIKGGCFTYKGGCMFTEGGRLLIKGRSITLTGIRNLNRAGLKNCLVNIPNPAHEIYKFARKGIFSQKTTFLPML